MKVLLTGLLLWLFPYVVYAEESKVRVAMLISGYGEEGDPSISYDLEELAQSYLVLTRNNVTVDIITPKGGKVNVKNNKDGLPFIQEFKRNTPALKQLNKTLPAKLASNNKYQALFIVGGDGAMFDLPFDANTQDFIKSFVEQDLPIAAVCHGPAALINITKPNGDYFVKGKQINSFTLREEQAFSKSLLSKFPFMLETELVKRGAKFQSNAPMLPFVAEDGNLITAQNPMSVPSATEALLVKLDIVPQQRALFKDEATMALISKARVEGSHQIDIALAMEPDSYNMNYLALYGFYAYQLAETKQDKAIELEIMARIGKHFNHPKYHIALISAYIEQKQQIKAKALYQGFRQQYPDEIFPPHIAEQLLEHDK